MKQKISLSQIEKQKNLIHVSHPQMKVTFSHFDSKKKKTP